MKIEGQNPFTTLTDNSHAIYLTRAGLLIVGALLSGGGVYQLYSNWQSSGPLSANWFVSLAPLVAGPLGISGAFRITRSSVIIDTEGRNIRVLRRTMAGQSEGRYASDDIDDVELGKGDGAEAFIKLRLRSGGTNSFVTHRKSCCRCFT